MFLVGTSYIGHGIWPAEEEYLALPNPWIQVLIFHRCGEYSVVPPLGTIKFVPVSLQKLKWFCVNLGQPISSLKRNVWSYQVWRESVGNWWIPGLISPKSRYQLMYDHLEHTATAGISVLVSPKLSCLISQKSSRDQSKESMWNKMAFRVALD